MVNSMTTRISRPTKFRYQLQVRTVDGAGWENRPSGLSEFRNDPWYLNEDAWRLIRRGHATYETVRIWDNEEKKALELPTSCPVDPAAILRRNKRTAELKVQRGMEIAREREEVEIRSSLRAVVEEKAREEFQHVTVSTVDQFNQLNDMHKDFIIGDLAEAYRSTDIDGWGDEGAGYDLNKFVQNLINLGWRFDPRS